MSKLRNPEIEITFGDKVRRLRYDWDALAEIEDHAATFASGQLARMKSLRLMLWAGLRGETLDTRGRESLDTLSQKQVGEILQDATPAEVEAWAAAVGEANGIAQPDPPPPGSPPVPTGAESDNVPPLN